MTSIVLSNNIRIENPPPTVASRLMQRYTFDNPDYTRLERLGKWTGNTPETLALWERDGKTLILPYGTLGDVLYEMGPFACTISSETSRGDTTHDYMSSIKLYPYQEDAVTALLKSQKGVLVAPCGSGKTQMGLEVAARLGMKTLWITHTHDLLNQSMGRAKQVFDLPASAFGAITAGKVEVGSVITFATVQTMVKLDLRKYRDTWGCVIVDEAHHVAGTPTKLMQFSKVVGNLNAACKFGLTATPKRADGMIGCMFAYLGPKAYEIEREAVGDKTCQVEYMQIQTGFDCPYDDFTNPDGTLNYIALITAVCRDKARNEQVARVVKDLLDMDGARILVLSERVSQLQMIWDLVKDGSIVTGGTRKDLRDKSIIALKAGESRLMFSTYQLAKEGLDVPELTHLVMASPNKTDTVITQAVGRVARACPGKNRGVVIDFADPMFPLSNWVKRRERIYRRLGYKPR